MMWPIYSRGRITLIPDGDWKPVDGEDFEARSPREWVFEPYPDTDAVTSETEYEELVAQYMS